MREPTGPGPALDTLTLANQQLFNDFLDTYNCSGVHGVATGIFTTGVEGGGGFVGVLGVSSGDGYHIGVLGEADPGGVAIVAENVGGDAAQLYGTVLVSADLAVGGTIHKSGGGFKIDHPQDPANRYLSHSFVESPDMLNVYSGNVVTDQQGRANVSLPPYFEALNQNFRYQLTVIGQFAHAIVAEEITENAFVVRTDKPAVKVSWQVTGTRRDPYAAAHPIAVEQDKPVGERDRYIHPTLYGRPDSDGLHTIPEVLSQFGRTRRQGRERVAAYAPKAFRVEE